VSSEGQTGFLKAGKFQASAERGSAWLQKALRIDIEMYFDPTAGGRRGQDERAQKILKTRFSRRADQ
jgi:hypothetical protein